MSGEYRIVLMSAPGAEVGRQLARVLVEERLAACGSVVPSMTSVYRWQGAVEEEAEALVMLKTTAHRVERLTARARDLHPYEVPEIVALPVAGGNAEYLAWVGEETRDARPEGDDARP